jgi:hypothetical protein
MFFVVRGSDASKYLNLICNASNQFPFLIIGPTGDATVTNAVASGQTVVTAADITAWNLIGSSQNGTALSIRTSSSSNSGTVASGSWTVTELGTYLFGTSVKFLGSICEVIFYNAVLTSAQRLAVINYLKNKYGVS